MQSNRNIIFIAVGLIVCFALIWFFSNQGGKRYNWNNSYNVKNDQPYGLNAFARTLAKKYPEFIRQKKHAVSSLGNSESKIDYYAIGHSLYYTRKELDSLYQFVKRGNNVFLAFKYISDTALMKFGIPKYELHSFHYDSSTVRINFTHPKLKREEPIVLDHHKNYRELSSFSWTYLAPVDQFSGRGLKQISGDFFEQEFEDEYAEYADEEYNEDDYSYEEEPSDEDEDGAFGREDTLSTEDSLNGDQDFNGLDAEIYVDGSFYFGEDVLDEVEPVKSVADIAYINQPEKVIFKRYGVGEGYVYILAEPLVLGNFYYSNDTTVQVAKGILSHFSANKGVLDLEAPDFKMGSISVDISNTPLRYMLSKLWFKVGIYSLLAIALLFILLNSFRKRRAVPVFNLPNNRSIEQIKNVAAVLYSDKDLEQLKRYLKSSFDFWKSQNSDRLKRTTDHKEELERLEFLSRKDLWDANQIKEFQVLYNQLKIKYGK